MKLTFFPALGLCALITMTYWNLSKTPQKGSIELNSWFFDYSTGESDLVQENVNGQLNFDSTAYPFSSTGLLFYGTGGICTAFLIGPQEIMTAAHCVINKKKKKFFNNITVSFNNFDNRRHESSSKAYPVMGGWDLKRKFFLPENDWFLLKLDKPIGEKNGWIGLKNSDGKTTLPSQSIEQETINQLNPKWIKTSSNILSNLRDIEYPWLLTYTLLDKNYEKTMTILPSFMFATRLDKINNDGVEQIFYPMSISYDCHLRGMIKNSLIDDCSSSEGSSGSSYLEIVSNKAYAIAISSQSKQKFSTHNTYKKNYKIYLDLFSINNLITNNAQNSPEYKKIISRLKQNAPTLLPITSQNISEIMSRSLQAMKDSQSTQEDFEFDIHSKTQEQGQGKGKNDHYNLAVPTDNFFDQVSQYLKSQ